MKWCATLLYAAKNIVSFAFGVFYTFVLSHFTKYAFSGIGLLNEFEHWVTTQGIHTGIGEYSSNWIAPLIGNRRFVGCVYTARVKWRSKIEIELLGI